MREISAEEEELRSFFDRLNAATGRTPNLQELELYAKLQATVLQELGGENPLFAEVGGMLKRKALNSCINDNQNVEYYEYYLQCLLTEAPFILDSFCLYMEKKRPKDKRFYEPRRSVLRYVVKDLQDLEDGKIKFYGLSMPPRVGKSTICIFFLAWVMGRHPDSHNAMGGHSGILAKGFYQEILNLITTDEYTYAEIFPDLLTDYGNHGIIQRQNAEELTINIGNPDRFATLTCRGIDGTWTGAIDVSGYLYVDDLVRDREHSLSPQRMEATFQEYLNKMVDRMNDGAKQLMVGTLWSVLDPLSRLAMKYNGHTEYRFRKIPALNDNDESNFNYRINGFSTAYYKEMRNRLEKPEWMAKYQQKPFIREGLLFPSDSLRYFNGIVPPDAEDGEKSYYVVACDVSFGGGDYLSMPIGLHYPDGTVYIVDWIYSNSSTGITVPVIVSKIMSLGIMKIVFEKNNGGQLYCDKVSEQLRSLNYPCSCQTMVAPNKISKEDKISAYSDYIKRNFVFLEESKRSTEYRKAMEDLQMYVIVGKNPHDDAPDSLSQLAMQLDHKERIQPTRIIRGGIL